MIRSSDERRLRLEELDGLIQQARQDLREQDWVERLLENDDLKRLQQVYKDRIKLKRQELIDIQQLMISSILRPDELSQLHQKALIYKQLVDDVDNFLRWPLDELQRLKELNSKLVTWEDERAELRRKVEDHDHVA